MRLLLPLLMIMLAASGCVQPQSPAAAEGLDEIPCSLSIRAEPEAFRAGETTRVVATVRNCSSLPMTITSATNCGFGPRLVSQGLLLPMAGVAEAPVCGARVDEALLPPGSTRSFSAEWDGRIAACEAGVCEAEAGTHELVARIRLGDAQGPVEEASVQVAYTRSEGPECGLSIRAEPPAFARGENVTVTATLRNCTDHVQTFFEGADCDDGPWLAFEGQHYEIWTTARQDGLCRSMTDLTTVEPREAIEWSKPWNGTTSRGCEWACEPAEWVPAGNYTLFVKVGEPSEPSYTGTRAETVVAFLG